MDKSDLRKILLQKRRSLSLAEWTSRSQLICQQVQKLPAFQKAKTVLTYTSFKQEPDLSGLLQDTSKVWGLPRCVGESMIWHLYLPDQLQSGAFGILEPQADAPTLQPEQVDLILVPCVGCDRQNYRLGYGGGFYDRMFSDPEWARILSIGITFEFGLVEAIEVEPWDRSLHGACTELGLVALQDTLGVRGDLA
jgi:5-formyltetrahydrofolate cyclo-ligase